jgi:hypothetical protein
MGVVIFYVLFVLFCGSLAWFVSGFPGVRRLDDRAAAALKRAWSATFRRQEHTST